MKLEDQVCNLESAKRLKELGIKQESLFYWKSTINGHIFLSFGEIVYNGCRIEASAFTGAELGEMLPVEIEIVKTFGVNGWALRHYTYRDGSATNLKFGEWIRATTEADARVKMLIYLKEEHII